MLKLKPLKYFNNSSTFKSFTDGVKPVLLICTLSGIAPFKYVLSKNPKAYISFPLLAYSSALFIAYINCVVRVLMRDETLVDFINISQLLKFSDKFRITIGLFCLLFVFGEGLFFINRYAVHIKCYMRVDEMMNNLGINKNYNKLYKQSLALVIVTQLLNNFFELFVIWTMSSWPKKPSWEFFVALFCPGYYTELFLLVYGFAALLVRRDIILVNEQLANLCDEKLLYGMDNNSDLRTSPEFDLNDVNKEIRNKCLIKKINTIWIVFDRICDLTEGIHEGFALKVLVFVTMGFISIILNMFYVVSIITSMFTGDNSEYLEAFLFFSLQQATASIIFITFITTMCEQCNLKVNDTRTLVNKLLMQEDSEDVDEQLHRFSSFMLHRRPTFNILGMFPIDNTLVFTIIGATTTYLIILIQFSVALWEDPEKLNPNLNGTANI